VTCIPNRVLYIKSITFNKNKAFNKLIQHINNKSELCTIR